MAGLKLHFFCQERKIANKIMLDYFGKIPTKKSLIKLFAATPFSDVYIGVLNNGLYAEHYESEKHGLTGCCHLVRAENKVLRLHQELHILFKKNQNRGLGKRLFSNQVSICRKLGVDEIIMFARKTHLQCGYYTLPRFGFKGPIPSSYRAKMPEKLKKVECFTELFGSEEGKNWWKLHGGTIEKPLIYQVKQARQDR
ncbi:MAG: hypothetical protein ACRC2T_10605 [Thermoguttaceae bacterium]